MSDADMDCSLGGTENCTTCGGREWTLRLICCGHDQGTTQRATWGELDAIRTTYVTPVLNSDHDRSAIIEHCPDCPSSPENVEEATCGHSLGELWAHEECEIDRSLLENAEEP